VAHFNGGDVTSDAGSLLLREVELRTGILAEFARCFTDHRDPKLTEHSVLDLVSQRIYGICLGYEDLNDHDDLRLDPLLAALVGKLDPKGGDRRLERDRGKALAGKSTLNRLELSDEHVSEDEPYKKIALDQKAADRLFVMWFLDAHEEPPEEIVLDLDATDDPLHGKQEGRFFSGYYREYCYLPLYIFCGEFLLCARLRTADKDASKGSVDELDWIISLIRKAWPEVRIIVRADSGFCREDLMATCEALPNVDYVLGLQRNARLIAAIGKQLAQAERGCERTGEATRVFKNFYYQPLKKKWSRSRRVVAKAEHIPGKSNPRFIVTSLSCRRVDAKTLYESRYCARGDMENRIKECQLNLFADRTSTSQMRSNQIRLTLSSVAYVLLQMLRRFGLEGTEMAKAQCGTIRTKLLKIGARVKVTVRRIWVAMSSAYPYQDLLARILTRLQRWRPLPA
jgi:hypothetical protein